MKRLSFCFLLFLGFAYAIVAEEIIHVASFSMQPMKYSNDRPVIIPDSLHYKEYASGDDIAYPFLIKIENKVGIYDYLAKRIILLDVNFRKESIIPFEAEGRLQFEKFRVKVEAESVAVYLDSRVPKSQIVVKLPNTNRPFLGGVWYQSDTLFFYDQAGNLYAVEHPISSDPDHYYPNTGNKIRDEKFVQELIQNDRSKRFSGLSWNDRYRLTKDGYPVSRAYNRDWQQFFADKRKESGIAFSDKYQPIPTNWFNAMNLIDIANDGTIYWGGARSIFVTQKGFLINTIKWNASVRGPLIMPSGDILLQSAKPENNVFDIYRIDRTW